MSKTLFSHCAPLKRVSLRCRTTKLQVPLPDETPADDVVTGLKGFNLDAFVSSYSPGTCDDEGGQDGLLELPVL